jgi:hypothetical protein
MTKRAQVRQTADRLASTTPALKLTLAPTAYSSALETKTDQSRPPQLISISRPPASTYRPTRTWSYVMIRLPDSTSRMPQLTVSRSSAESPTTPLTRSSVRPHLLRFSSRTRTDPRAVSAFLAGVRRSTGLTYVPPSLPPEHLANTPII